MLCDIKYRESFFPKIWEDMYIFYVYILNILYILYILYISHRPHCVDVITKEQALWILADWQRVELLTPQNHFKKTIFVPGH